MKLYDDLYAFSIASNSRTISTAAKKLNLSTAALSTLLARLEERLGCTLIIRHRNGLSLTPEGQELYNGISSSFNQLHTAVSKVSNHSLDSIDKEIKILTTTGVLSDLVLKAVDRFYQDNPDYSINVRTYDGPVNYSEFNVDVGILPTVLDIDNVHKNKITSLKSCMFCSEGYIKKYGKPKNLADLRDHKFVGYYNSHTGYKGNVDWHLKYSNSQEADHKINLASAQIIAAKLGWGILAIPEEIVSDTKLVKIFPEEHVLIDVFAITSRNQRNSYVDNFISCVKNYFDTKGDQNDK